MIVKFLSRSFYIDSSFSVQFLRSIYMIYGIFASQEEDFNIMSEQASEQLPKWPNPVTTL